MPSIAFSGPARAALLVVCRPELAAGRDRLMVPEGSVRVNFVGRRRPVEVVRWQRLDGFVSAPDFTVMVEARATQDAAFPLSSVQARLRLTCDPTHVVWVGVGEWDQDGWFFGARVWGAEVVS